MTDKVKTDEKKGFPLRVKKSLYERIEQRAGKENRSVNNMIETVLEKEFKS